MIEYILVLALHKRCGESPNLSTSTVRREQVPFIHSARVVAEILEQTSHNENQR